MAIKFLFPTRHGTKEFVPNISLGFEDEGAEEYFTEAGLAEATDTPPGYIYPEGSVEIDREAVHASTGKPVFVDDSTINGG
jgi:hypothetical protein